MHNRQVVTFQIGGTGGEVGGAFWSQIVSEHGLEYSRIGLRVCGESSDSLLGVSVFFDESRNGVYKPRTVYCDLSNSSIHSPAINSFPISCYDNKSVVVSNDGSGNCYAQAFHCEGLPVAGHSIEAFRKTLESCDSLQGVRFIHSLSGGTGSGLGGLLMRSVHDYLDTGSKCLLYSACVVPSHRTSDNCLSTYNTLLGLQDLLEYTHMVFPYDIDAVHGQSKDPYPFIAECLSGLTASMRFPGLVNADLRKIYSNSVVFKNMHFLVTSFSKNEKTVGQLAHQVMESGTSTMSCDIRAEDERVLSSFMAFRGKSIPMSLVHDAIGSVRLYKNIYSNWNPNCVSASICSQPVKTNTGCLAAALTCVHNTTAISQFLDCVTASFDRKFASRSHVYLYEENGLHVNEFEQARNLVRSVSDLYKEHRSTN